MQREFSDSYEELFNCAYSRLNRAHKIKLLAIKFCNQNAEKLHIDRDKTAGQGIRRKLTIDQQKVLSKNTLKISEDVFQPIPMNDVDNESSIFDDSSSLSFQEIHTESEVDSEEMKDEVGGLAET